MDWNENVMLVVEAGTISFDASSSIRSLVFNSIFLLNSNLHPCYILNFSHETVGKILSVTPFK